MSTNGHTNDNPFEGWVTLEEAATKVGRDLSTVRGWADRGVIKTHPIGKRVRVVWLEEALKYSEEIAPRKPRRKRDSTG
jgi:hypothetical protein